MGQLKPALEVIDFQNDDFGKKIETILTEVYDFIYPNKEKLITTQKANNILVFAEEHKISERLSTLIFNRLGIRTTFIFNTNTIGATYPFFINKNSILIDPAWRDGMLDLDPVANKQNPLIKSMVNKKGFIDLKHAKVSGIFSEYNHNVYTNFYYGMVSYKLTPGEVTGILLHELGHDFTYYEFADRLETTNQVLANLANVMQTSNDVKEREYCFVELEKIEGFNKGDFDELKTETNRVIFGIKLSSILVGSIQSQLKQSKYDQTASEQLADNFAMRFKYGRELIIALDKLHVFALEKNPSLRLISLFIEALNEIYTLAAILSAIMGSGIAIGCIGLIVHLLIIYVTGSDVKNMTYDELRIRYTRIRHQYIEQISHSPLSKSELKNIVDAVHSIDSIINQIRDYRSVLGIMSDIIFSKNRNAKKSIELQQLLEELSHNDLFLKSAHLKTL